MLPLNANIGGQIRSDKHKYEEHKYLTEDQARHAFKKIESGNIININTLKWMIHQDWELSRLNDTSRDINPYRELIVNNEEKVETVLSPKEQWSILSNIFNYIQYNKHPKNFHNLNIRAVNKEKYKRKSDIEKEVRQMLQLDFGDMPGKINGRIFRCIWNPIGNVRHYYVWCKLRFKHNILGKSRHN